MSQEVTSSSRNGGWFAALITGLFSLIGNALTNLFTNKQQKAANAEAAATQLQNQKELIDYQNQVQQDTNMVSTQKGHMVSAGYSPALMYGSSIPTASVTGGSSQVEPPKFNPLQLFDRLPLESISGTIMQGYSQDIQRQRMQEENARDRALANKYMMETAHDAYNLGLAKKLEKTIIDKSLYDLENSKATAANTRFMTEHAMRMEPFQLVNAQLINDETAQRIEKIKSDIVLNGIEGAHLRADMNRMSHLNGLTDAQRDGVIESTKRGALGRVMQEFGLTNRLTPAQLRSASALHSALNSEQMKGAYITLRQLGYSEHEATNAVLYYTAQDPKDVTPSVVNAASRIFSAFVLHK